MSASPTARISSGLLRGTVENDVCVFRAVPYAAPPVGPLRFAMPAPVTAWTGERDASRNGPVPPQPPSVCVRQWETSPRIRVRIV